MNTKWNLQKLFIDENIEDYTEEQIKSWNLFIEKHKKDKSFLKSPDKLKKSLDELAQLETNYAGKNLFFYRLKQDIDLDNTEVKQKYTEISKKIIDIQNRARFFELELGKVNDKTRSMFLESPILTDYRYFLKRLFILSDYFLTDKLESVLNLLSSSSHGNWIDLTEELLNTEKTGVEDHGEKKEISFSELKDRMKSSDQEIREDANNKFNKILLRYKKVAQYEINSILDTKKIEDDLRGFKYPEEYNYVHNDIPKKFVDLLVHQVENRNDISERYYQLKAELMGKKKLEYYERNVPYGKISKKYKFEEAYDIVSKAYKNLDEDFYNIFVNLFDTGSVDVYPGIGKRLGAYCAPHSVSTPLYLLLNFSGNVDDIMTIAHECGHAVNFEMMKQIKNPFYYGVSSIALEVASTFFEDFACDELEKTLSDEERLGLLMERLNSSVSTIQRQIACFKFEQDLHRDFRQNKYVSSDNIGKLFQFRMKEYMGDFVDDPDYSKNWWVYWSHIRHFFYVYSYACGELISKYFRKQVKEDKKWINNFKDFLKAGTADSPINTFRKVGVDISSADIWNSGLDEMEEQLNTAEKLARKLGKI